MSWAVVSAFPSPCGEKVGINPTKMDPVNTPVSVVSVPLRGKGRDQRLTGIKIPEGYDGFPSPCGEKVGINCNPPDWREILLLELVSVPLRGKGRDQRISPGCWLGEV